MVLSWTITDVLFGPVAFACQGDVCHIDRLPVMEVSRPT